MRVVPYNEPTTEAEMDAEDGDPTLGYNDWKDSPSDVLDRVDELLRPYGLEVVMLDTGSDDYQYRIAKREPV